MSTPLISVVIATYNTGFYLPETLDSVLEQTYTNREIIVVDDGSTDNTYQLIAPYLSRIRYIPQKHGGLAAARNTGLRVMEGDFIALLDADDLWLPDKLALQMEVAQRHPESGLIACDGVEFEHQAITKSHLLIGSVAKALLESQESETTGYFYDNFITTSVIGCPAQTLLPRRIVEEVGAFGDFFAQDYDYYLRVSRRFPITLHRHSLVRWRYRGESMSGTRLRRNMVWNLQRLPVLQSHLRCCDGIERNLFKQQLDKIVFHTAVSVYNYGNTTDKNFAIEAFTELFHSGRHLPVLLIFIIALQCPSPISYYIYQWFLAFKSKRVKPVNNL